MSLFYLCAHGHRWRRETHADATQVDAPIRCPTCGAGGHSVADDNGVNARGSDTESLLPESPHSAANDANAETLARSGPAADEEEIGLPEVRGYELLGELGRGAMGVVYKARHFKLNRLVALKMVRAGSHAESSDLVRFLAEAEAAAQLQHPHIVQVHEIGRHGSLPFLSLEYVDGGTLGQKMRGPPLQPREAAETVETLARAVHYAHDHGIIHRDLKPGNVLLTGNSVPKITDFGLAKRVEAAAGMTQTGVILGTPSYMAPEQAEGKKDVGPAADTYALGAILYEMLTGRPPFQAPTPLDTVLQLLGEEPVPPRRLQSTVPRDLETICLKCLQKEPRKRYASADALADDLRRFLGDEPILARPVGRVERAWRWCRRNPVVATLSAAVVVCIVVAGVLLNQQRTNTISNLHRAEGAERERSEQLARSYLDQARARRYSRQPGQRFESLSAIREAAKLARDLDIGESMRNDLRNEAIASLALVDIRLVPTDFATLDGATAVAFDSTYTLCAESDPSGQTSIRRVSDGVEISRFAAAGLKPNLLRFSPDGRYLAGVSTDGRCFYVDRTAETAKPELFAPPCHGLAFSTDSHRIAISQAGEILILDLATRKKIGGIRSGFQGQNDFAFSPNDKQIAVVPRGWPLVKVYDVETQRLLHYVDLGRVSESSGPVWHPDGERVAIGTADGRAMVVNVVTQNVVAVMEGHVQHVSNIAFSRTGAVLITQSWDNTNRFWNTATGELVLTYTGTITVSGSGSGRVVGVSSDEAKHIQLIELEEGLEYQTIATSLGAGQALFRDADVSPDGQLLAVAMDDGTRLYHLSSGRELAFLQEGQRLSAVFGPRGEELYTCGPLGLNKWPIQASPDARARLILGPVVRIPIRAASLHTLSLSQDGRTAVVGDEGFGKSTVVDLQTGQVKPIEMGHTRAGEVTISPDAKWSVSFGWHAPVQRVWNARTGQLATELNIGSGGAARFTPDSLQLITSVPGEYCFWDVETWKPGRRLKWDQQGIYAGPIAFSGDRKVIALPLSSGIIDLMNWKTYKTLARLEDPMRERPARIRFHPADTKLVTMNHYSRTLHVWDLGKIREELVELDLDWDADPLSTNPEPPGPLDIRVEWGSATAVDTNPIVVLPAKAMRREAKPEEIAQWIKQLSGSENKEREASAEALEAVGPPALPALTKAADGADASLTKRLNEIMERIEVAEAVAPTRVNLELKDATIADAVAALSRQSGISMIYQPKVRADRKPPATVTLVLDGVPFWEALDRLCRAAGLVSNWSGPQAMGLTDGTSPPRGTLSVTGPLRVEASHVYYNRTTSPQQPAAPTENLTLNINVVGDANTRIVSSGPIQIREATDAQGADLRVKSSPPLSPFFDPFTTGFAYHVKNVTLRSPAELGGTLKHFQGILPVEVMIHPREVLTIAEPAKANGKALSGEDGLRMFVQSVNQFEEGQLYIQFLLSVPERKPFEPNNLRARLTTDKEKRFDAGYSWISPLGGTFRELEPEDLAWWTASADGGFAALPWTKLAPRSPSMQRKRWQGSVQFYGQAQSGRPIQLTLYRFDRRRTELPFEFHDLPLP